MKIDIVLTYDRYLNSPCGPLFIIAKDGSFPAKSIEEVILQRVEKAYRVPDGTSEGRLETLQDYIDALKRTVAALENKNVCQ